MSVSRTGDRGGRASTVADSTTGGSGERVVPGPEKERRALRATISVAALALMSLTSGCASGGPPEPPPRIEAPGFGVGVAEMTDLGGSESFLPPPPTAEELADPILGSPLAEDREVRRRVNYWILRWQTWGQGHFHRYLERMERYGELVDRKIAERGLPASLRYLPVVESGYNPMAVSPMGAAGMWQFMTGTARFLGLDVTPLVDERLDPWRSTEIALDYLDELHDRFDGSWFLALAAYNGGWGRIERIVERHAAGAAPSDSLFWALRERFPRETRDFVPKLLAAARLAREPAAYGFRPVGEIEPIAADVIRVPDATSLDVVARAADVSIEEVERLNPHIRRGYTPPDRETALRVPAGTRPDFEERYARIPADERVTFIEHRVRRGETFSHVAYRYGVTVAELRAANPGIRPRRLQVGQWVVVPRSPTATSDGPVIRRTAAAAGAEGPSVDGSGDLEAASTASESDADGVSHRVSRGESLWVIARRYGVGVDDLRRWNDLEPGAVLHPGDELRVRGASVTVYRVQPGDTLSEIALRHGVSTGALLRANGLSRRAVIRPGDEVRIPGQPGS